MTLLGYFLALVIGLSLGVLGGGGSILTIPVLHYVMGYSVREAVPMSLVVVGFTSAIGAVGHWQKGNVQFRTALAFGIPAIVGAVFGADLGPRVADGIRLTIFAAVMLAAAVSMMRASPEPAPGAARPRIPGVTLIGAVTGFLTGFVGVGGGFIYVPVLTLLGGLSVRQAIGTSLLLIVLSCIGGIARYLGHPELDSLDWPVVALFTAIALVGVMVGSRIASRVSQAGLRKGFAVFLLVLGLVVLLVRP